MPDDFGGEFLFPKVLTSKSIFLNPNTTITKIRFSARYLRYNLEGNMAAEVSADGGQHFETLNLEEFSLSVGSGFTSTGEKYMTNTGSEIQYRMAAIGIKVEEIEVQYNFST